MRFGSNFGGLKLEKTMQRLIFFRQHQVWVPTIAGFIFLLLICVVAGILLLNNLYTFLAQNEPVNARILVV